VLGVAFGVLALALAGDAIGGARWVAASGPAVLVQPAPMPAAPAAPAPAAPGHDPVPSPSVSPSDNPSPVPSRSKPPVLSWPSGVPRPTRTVQPVPGTLASHLHTLPAGTTQVIVAYASGYGVTTGTLETFQKVNGYWRPALPPMPMRLGGKGFNDHKVEGDLTTPTGMYAIGATMYGIAGNPGVRYAYHQLVANDWWNENPSSPGYNSFVHGGDPGGASEALWQVSPQYNYFAVINYNIPVVPANPARGSGIFLHVAVNGPTAGCLALAQSDLLAVLRWLNPADSPRIVMAPRTVLSRY